MADVLDLTTSTRFMYPLIWADSAIGMYRPAGADRDIYVDRVLVGDDARSSASYRHGAASCVRPGA